MKNHAFIMPVYKSPKLLARILHILEADNHYFFIHVDKRTKNYDEFVSECQHIKNVIFVPRINVYHGTISQVYASIEMLKACVNHPVHFHFVHQISGQDYPLRSNKIFDDFFENTEDSFMCYNFENELDELQPLTEKSVMGYYANKFPVNKVGQIYRIIYNKIGNSKLVKTLFPREPIKNLIGGWDWFTWSDKVVNYVMTYIEENRFDKSSLLVRLSHTNAPSEKFYTTLLFDKLERLKVRKYYPLRFVSWTPHHPINVKRLPYPLNELDYEYVVNSPTFFCRKIEEVESAKLLDMIDAQRDSAFNIEQFTEFT